MEQYIPKSALVAEIEKLIANGKEKCQQSKENNALGSYIAWSEHIATCGKILSFINTIEVKEDIEHYELEEFAKIVRGNLTGINKNVQTLFEAKYQQLTGNKMYGGYKD